MRDTVNGSSDVNVYSSVLLFVKYQGFAFAVTNGRPRGIAMWLYKRYTINCIVFVVLFRGTREATRAILKI